MFSCGNRTRKDEPVLTKEEEHLKLRGEALCVKYCSGCHLTADPKLLDRTTWVSVLSQMQVQMSKAGIEIKREEWDTVWKYYEKFSPIILDNTREHPIRQIASQFSGNDSLIVKPARANITLLSFRSQDGSLFAGDASRNLYRLRSNIVDREYKLNNVPVDIAYDSVGSNVYVLCIGNLRPNEHPTGQLLSLNLETGSTQVLVDSLDRPIHLEKCDLDQDGQHEFMISCFGSTLGRQNTGGVVYAKKSNGVWRKEDFKVLEGASKTIAKDLDGNGTPDVIALFAQGRESVILFRNTLTGFHEETVVTFPPVYGVTDMALADLDGDGDDDLIVANGDNGDFSVVSKPYHGVRIFRNTGSTFEEWIFQPIHGAARMRLRDFDLDGDIDIAVLSIYPDLFHHPEETLVLLENREDTFHAKTLVREPSLRWMIIEAGDIDNDGDDDVITGANLILSFPIPAAYTGRFRNAKNAITVFENATR